MGATNNKVSKANIKIKSQGLDAKLICIMKIYWSCRWDQIILSDFCILHGFEYVHAIAQEKQKHQTSIKKSKISP